WFHSIDLGGGVVTPGQKAPIQHEREAAAFFDRVELSGCSVLDIGAWNGFFSFEAKRRGARRVLAADSYWWTQPVFQGRKTFELARRASLSTSRRRKSMLQISRLTLSASSMSSFFSGCSIIATMPSMPWHGQLVLQNIC